MRHAINAILGIIIMVLAFVYAKKLISDKAKPKHSDNKIIKTVFVDTVKNASIQVELPAHGNLVAAERIEIFSEVQGVFKGSSKLFKAGEQYQKGELLVNIDGSEYRASITSQKSNFYNQLLSLMPDLKMDYPEAFDKWNSYLTKFDVQKSLLPLPEPSSEKEKFFINGKNITSLFYTIKNMEEHYAKFQIRAPFGGILTEAIVTPGGLIRTGQKLGEYINPLVYELEVSVNKSFSDLLKLGKEVSLTNIDNSQTWKGKVARVNGKVDLSTQTIRVFIVVSGKGLSEGMYLKAQLETKSIENAYEISRKLLVNDTQVYVVKDSTLNLVDIEPVYFSRKTAVVRGLKDGELLVSKSVPGAYEGMLVKIEGRDSK